ncbi:hypothetical protein B0H14DRAFT_3646933 [Mycena olivaceomarginata]|nr:hypothetical protein B0H14DRAFT_3646933 [Mycena olivaceomarginata]
MAPLNVLALFLHHHQDSGWLARSGSFKAPNSTRWRIKTPVARRYLVWDVGLFTSRMEAKAYLDNPSSQALTQHLQRSDTLEKWGLLCGKHHQDEEYKETVPDSEPEQTSTGEVSQAPTRAQLALPYLPPPNLIYGHTIKEESPLALIKLELSRHQPSRSSSRVVRAMPTPNSNSPNTSPVSGVSAQSSQPTNVSVEGKQKALEGLSALRSKSSKAAAPVKSKQKSSRDDDKEVDKPPRKRQKKSEEGSANGSTATSFMTALFVYDFQALLPAAAFLWIAKGFIYYALAPTAFVGALIALSSVVRDVRRWRTPAPNPAALEGGTADPLQVYTSISPPSSSPELGHNLLLLLLSTLFFLGCITAFGDTTIFEMTVRRIVGASPVRWARRVAWLVVFALYRRGSGWVHETYIPQVGWNVELEPDLPAAAAKSGFGGREDSRARVGERRGGEYLEGREGSEGDNNCMTDLSLWEVSFLKLGTLASVLLGGGTPVPDQLVRIPLRNSLLVEEFPETLEVYSQYSGYHPGVRRRKVARSARGEQLGPREGGGDERGGAAPNVENAEGSARRGVLWWKESAVSAEAGEVHGAAKGCADGVKAPAKYRVEAVAGLQHGRGVGARRMQPLEGADKSRVSPERSEGGTHAKGGAARSRRSVDQCEAHVRCILVFHGIRHGERKRVQPRRHALRDEPRTKSREMHRVRRRRMGKLHGQAERGTRGDGAERESGGRTRGGEDHWRPLVALSWRRIAGKRRNMGSQGWRGEHENGAHVKRVIVGREVERTRFQCRQVVLWDNSLPEHIEPDRGPRQRISATTSPYGPARDKSFTHENAACVNSQENKNAKGARDDCALYLWVNIPTPNQGAERQMRCLY